jgi:hypothetical protein
MTAYSDCATSLAGEAARPARQPYAAAEAETLARSGRFEETYEWRIGTETTRGIERRQDGFRVWSETDGTWEALVATEAEARAASYVLSRLQQKLFYVIGWASWTSATQREEDAPAREWSPLERDSCERYLAHLWREGRARAKSIADESAAAIAAGGSWRSETSTLRPGHHPASSERRTWFEAQTRGPGLRFTSHSPTVARAAEFLSIYERLADDIPREHGWRTPGNFPEDRL